MHSTIFEHYFSTFWYSCVCQTRDYIGGDAKSGLIMRWTCQGRRRKKGNLLFKNYFRDPPFKICFLAPIASEHTLSHWQTSVFPLEIKAKWIPWTNGCPLHKQVFFWDIACLVKCSHLTFSFACHFQCFFELSWWVFGFIQMSWIITRNAKVCFLLKWWACFFARFITLECKVSKDRSIGQLYLPAYNWAHAGRTGTELMGAVPSSAEELHDIHDCLGHMRSPWQK